MTIPSSESSVISYDRFILVIGGAREDSKYIAAVQVLDTSKRQWYQTGTLVLYEILEYIIFCEI